MQIRTAVLADAASLIELWAAAGLKFRPADVPAELQAVLARDPELVVVAEDADGLAAAVLGTFDGRRGWVNRLATRPDRRGHGHASAVLAELERRLTARGCRKVNLLIEPDNERVTGFYRRHGYTEDQLIFMEKWLPADTSRRSAMASVRTAAATDATAIAVLLTQLGYPCTADDAAARLGYWLTDPMSRVLLAERDDLVIGCLSLHAVPYLERTGRWARIESLVIEESARGTGAGSALLRTAEKVARRWGCLAMEVTSARTREDAHAFYQRMGYTDVCSRSGRFLKELG